jgi:hypothetical protein
LKQHVANELFASTPTAVVRAIDRVCIVSIGGDVEDCTTLLSWRAYPYGVNNYIADISGRVMVSGSYTVGYVRIKAGDVVYFESGVSSPFYVFSGQVVSFTIRLTFLTTHSPSVGGGLPGIVYVSSRGLLGLLVDILRGVRPAGTYLTLERVRWEDEWGETILDVPLSRSYSPGAISGSAFHDFVNFVASGNLYKVVVDCVGRQYCLSYTLSSTLSVTMADRARFSVFVEVGYWLGLSDLVGLGLSDGWGCILSMSLDLGDVVDLVLSDVWGYGLVRLLSLGDSVDFGLFDGWDWSVVFGFGLDDSVDIGLSDGWVVWMDEIQLVSFVGVGVSYPAVVDVVDSPAITVSVVVSYPAIVDVVDLIVGAGVSVG